LSFRDLDFLGLSGSTDGSKETLNIKNLFPSLGIKAFVIMSSQTRLNFNRSQLMLCYSDSQYIDVPHLIVPVVSASRERKSPPEILYFRAFDVSPIISNDPGLWVLPVCSALNVQKEGSNYLYTDRTSGLAGRITFRVEALLDAAQRRFTRYNRYYLRQQLAPRKWEQKSNSRWDQESNASAEEIYDSNSESEPEIQEIYDEQLVAF
jgi:hypothetical protein